MSYINNCSNSIVLPPITLADVRQTVMSMKNSTAGWDEFPVLVAKQSIDSYIEPLTCLINRSFNPIRSGMFQTANDPGDGGGGALTPPPAISKTIVSMFTLLCMCILLGVSK